eukprot:2220592-Pleurochrysis_carterae.AAC.1
MAPGTWSKHRSRPTIVKRQMFHEKKLLSTWPLSFETGGFERTTANSKTNKLTKPNCADSMESRHEPASEALYLLDHDGTRASTLRSRAFLST